MHRIEDRQQVREVGAVGDRRDAVFRIQQPAPLHREAGQARRDRGIDELPEPLYVVGFGGLVRGAVAAVEGGKGRGALGLGREQGGVGLVIRA